MYINKRLTFYLVIFTALLSLPCQAQDSQTTIIGKWFFNDFLEETVILEFTEKQMIIEFLSGSNREVAEYIIVNDKIVFDENLTFEYEIPDANTLNLRISNNESSYEYSGKKMNLQNISSLSGKFSWNNGIGFKTMLEFIDGKNLRIAAISSYATGVILGEYEIRLPYVIIIFKDEAYPDIYGGVRALEIISDTILKGDTIFLGGSGYYIRDE